MVTVKEVETTMLSSMVPDTSMMSPDDATLRAWETVAQGRDSVQALLSELLVPDT